MSDWREEFKRELVDVLLEQGMPLRSDANYYSWVDYDWKKIIRRIRKVGVDYERTTYEESEWDEFMGTFYEGDERKQGIDVHVVLLDGSRVEYRWSGHPGQLIIALVRDKK